jgi:hypothetical protein
MKNIEEKEFKTIQQIESQDSGWDEFRKEDGKYELKETHIPSLDQYRNILFLNTDHRDYELLQCSRGISTNSQHEKIDDLAKEVKEKIQVIPESEQVRINELRNLFGENLNLLKSVAELGFRIPKLLNFYLKEGFEKAVGYDVVSLNVIIGKMLGHDTRQYDFNNLDDNLDLEGIGLVISYHMLEHVSRPDLAVKKIYDAMDTGSFFHVEVPIEPNGPFLRYGHLYPFHGEDMGNFLQDAGFKIAHASNETHKGGPWIERYLVKKV